MAPYSAIIHTCFTRHLRVCQRAAQRSAGARSSQQETPLLGTATHASVLQERNEAHKERIGGGEKRRQPGAPTLGVGFSDAMELMVREGAPNRRTESLAAPLHSTPKRGP